MAGVSPGEVLDCANPKIDVFVKKAGLPIDPFILEFTVNDVSGGYPGTQIFPVAGRQLVDLTDCPTGDRVAEGNYIARFTVPAGAAPGSHSIKWYFKEVALGSEFTSCEEFEIFSPGAAPPGPFYIDVQCIRDCGVPDPPTNAEILDAIACCQELLERATRQWFEPRELEFFFDGTDSDAIHFGVPIIDVEFLRINNCKTDLDLDCYCVYNANPYPEDRKNPRIKLIRSTNNVDIFCGPSRYGDLRFRKGRKNQHIKGNFGFVEADGSTPCAIIEALKMMVIEKLSKPCFVPLGSTPIPPPPGAGGLGPVVQEVTDGHSIRYATATSLSSKKQGLDGITSNPFVQDIIRLYRAPIGISTPAHWSGK